MSPAPRINPTDILPGDFLIILGSPVKGFPVGHYRMSVQSKLSYPLVAKGGATYRVFFEPGTGVRVWMVYTVAENGIGYLGMDPMPTNFKHEINLDRRLGASVLQQVKDGKVKLPSHIIKPGECIVEGCSRTLAYRIGSTEICWLHILEYFPQLEPHLERKGDTSK